MHYKVRRFIFSAIWYTVFIPVVFIATLSIAILTDLDAWMRQWDPGWTPSNPFATRPPPPDNAIPTPEVDDSYPL